MHAVSQVLYGLLDRPEGRGAVEADVGMEQCERKDLHLGQDEAGDGGKLHKGDLHSTTSGWMKCVHFWTLLIVGLSACELMHAGHCEGHLFLSLPPFHPPVSPSSFHPLRPSASLSLPSFLTLPSFIPPSPSLLPSPSLPPTPSLPPSPSIPLPHLSLSPFLSLTSPSLPFSPFLSLCLPSSPSPSLSVFLSMPKVLRLLHSTTTCTPEQLNSVSISYVDFEVGGGVGHTQSMRAMQFSDCTVNTHLQYLQ